MEETQVTPKFNTGDKVKIINYGQLFWENKNTTDKKLDFPIIHETETLIFKDFAPELVGKEAIILYHSETQGQINYSLQIIGGQKMSWFNENQLELIAKNPNTL